jgi:hypothetical protein
LITKTGQRWLAVFVVVSVLCFTFLIVAHWHDGGHEEQQCGLCHFAHATPIDRSHGAILPVPTPVHEASVTVSIDPQLELVFHQRASRAPPSSDQLS